MRFGPYELLLPLEKGGMAEVFIAVRDGATEACIVKRVHEHLATEASMINRFRREAEVAALLDHPNIARVLDAGFVDGRFYIGMELVWGVDLATLFATATPDAPLPVGAARTIGVPLLAALGHAHALRSPDDEAFDVVHRDISARNVLVDRSGDVKLIDFGMARAKMGHFRTAADKFIAGTPPYMSPEQALGRPLDPRSDLYSVGVLLYELLTGRRLVENAPVPVMLKHVVRARPQPIAELRPEVPGDLSQVVARALARYPDDRWPDAAAFEAALAQTSTPPLERSELAELVRRHASGLEERIRQVERRLGARSRIKIPAEPTAAAPHASRRDDDATTFVADDGATTLPTKNAPKQGRPWIAFLALAAAMMLALVFIPRGDADPEPAPTHAPTKPPPPPVVRTEPATAKPAPSAPPPPTRAPEPRTTRRRRKPRPAPPPPPPPVVEAPPKKAPVTVESLLARTRRLRDRLAPRDPKRERVDDLLSELIVLRTSGTSRTRIEAAAERLERLERP